MFKRLHRRRLGRSHHHSSSDYWQRVCAELVAADWWHRVDRNLRHIRRCAAYVGSGRLIGRIHVFDVWNGGQSRVEGKKHAVK